ncbi:MAG TPA: carboxypeptidase-like regulatory domain-containing protein [Candidatus Sulfotelmatobacter sp.]|nr:carboxypeptidase-like regulatory domain-containing protein [Candidatus Sulfotelmatobacter sp.]
MKALRLFALMLAILPATALSLHAQSSEGRMLGTVLDQTGAVVSGARITITNTATNVSRQLVTTSTGEYIAPNLEPGSYTVVAEASGFKKVVSTQVVLEVSRGTYASI